MSLSRRSILKASIAAIPAYFAGRAHGQLTSKSDGARLPSSSSGEVLV